jgi:hypothetical protein
MTKNRISLRPEKTRSAEEFVSAAGEIEQDQTKQQEATPYPWEDERVRDDVIKSINLRLPEPYLLKLQYLSDITNKSQQALIREALLPYVDAQIEKLTK